MRTLVSDDTVFPSAAHVQHTVSYDDLSVSPPPYLAGPPAAMDDKHPSPKEASQEPDFDLHSDEEPPPTSSSAGKASTSGDAPITSSAGKSGDDIILAASEEVLPPIPAIHHGIISPDHWAALPPALRLSLVNNEASTRMACKNADEREAKLEKNRQNKLFRKQVADAAATDDECRSAEESSSSQVADLKKQLAAAETRQVRAQVARALSKKKKATLDKQALERLRATASPVASPIQTVPECNLRYIAVPCDYALLEVPINVLALHRQNAFLDGNARLVATAGRTLLAHMQTFPAGTLKLIIADQATSFMPSTVNAAYTLLFALREAYGKAPTTPHWPASISANEDSDRRGRPVKRGARSGDSKIRRGNSGGGSSSHGSSSSKRRNRGINYTTSGGSKGDTDTSIEKLQTPR
ncbi:unnamed protein product [Laminaria digitata]